MNAMHIGRVLLLVGLLGGFSSVAPAGGPSINIDVPSVVKVGQAVNVRVDGLPGNAQDWVTVVPATHSANRYEEWSYTKGKRAFQMRFQGLTKPGKYEVRVYFNWPAGQYKIQARRGFTVQK